MPLLCAVSMDKLKLSLYISPVMQLLGYVQFIFMYDLQC